MALQKKLTTVFYWTDYPLIPTLELFNARYLHHAETTDKFTGKPKLVGYVQFKTLVTPDDWEAICSDITWVNRRRAHDLLFQLKQHYL